MRVLVVGSGAREHALACRLADSRSVDAVEAVPGNPGMAELGPCHHVQPVEPQPVAEVAERRGADLVVVGPETPLVAGIADELGRRDIAVFGPTAAAARVEASKSYAKEVMAAAGVTATARYRTFTDAEKAIAALDDFGPPYVVKADGLAAGKGVTVADTRAQAVAAVEDALVRGTFGKAGATILLEEHLAGEEVSVFGICDGTDALLLPVCQDFKRAYDGDRGPNTGGMGAYTPVPGFGEEQLPELRDRLFRPVLAELANRGSPYRGVLYAGLVLTDEGPKVLEFNCRFGDPEAQAMLWRLTGDFGALLAAAADPAEGLDPTSAATSEDACVTVVLASGGYPGHYEVGLPISGLDEVAAGHPEVRIFHAGTRRENGRLVTAGGRVLSVTGRGADVAAARRRAYAAADVISWEGQHRRSDIALAAAGG